MKTQKQIDKHRKEAYITCPETCWCWEAQSKLNKEEVEVKENVSRK